MIEAWVTSADLLTGLPFDDTLQDKKWDDYVGDGPIDAIRVVQRNTRTPIATGENYFFRLDFQRLITYAAPATTPQS